MKKCPYCAEDIQDAATVCRFCNRDLPEARLVASPPAAGAKTVEPAKVRLPLPIKLVMMGAGALLVLSWLGGAPSPPAKRSVESAAPSGKAAPPVSVPPAPSPEPGSKWTGGVGARSNMDDSETVAFHLDAENEIDGWMKKHRPSLILRCREKSTDAYVTTGMSAQPEYGKMDEATVRLRFDDEAAANQVWTESTDNEALFAPRAITFIKRVAKAKVLRLQFTPFNSSPAIIEFNVAGLGDRIDLLAKTCNWPK